MFKDKQSNSVLCSIENPRFRGIMNGKIIRLSVVDSTNIYTTRLLGQSDIAEWTIVLAEMQTGGKGQRGKTWDSEMGKNLLCSIVLKPSKMGVQDQFFISMMVSVSIAESLSAYGIKSEIKWPNDVLVDGKKIAGILIENQVALNLIESSIIGIGLNLNQKEFSVYDWPATSLSSLLQTEVDLEDFLKDLIVCLRTNYQLMIESPKTLHKIYSAHLFRLNQNVEFIANNTVLDGLVRGVSSKGAILMECENRLSSFVNGEIRIKRT